MAAVFLITPMQYDTLKKIWERMRAAAEKNDKAEIASAHAAFETWKRQVEQ